MTQANVELLDALRDAGAADDKARAAAQSVATVGNVATKEDITAIRADMAAMESRLIRWMVGMIFPQYALLAFIALRLPG